MGIFYVSFVTTRHIRNVFYVFLTMTCSVAFFYVRSLILHMHLFFVGNRNMSTHILVNEAHFCFNTWAACANKGPAILSAALWHLEEGGQQIKMFEKLSSVGVFYAGLDLSS